jgi:urease gamma subunit
MSTIYLAKATRSEIAEELSLLVPIYRFQVTQLTGKKNFLSEGFIVTKLGKVVNICYKKDGLQLQELEEALIALLVDKEIPEHIARKEALEYLEKHQLRDAAKQHLTSAALKKQQDYQLIRLAEYLYSIHSPLTVANDQVLECYIASCLRSRKQRSKRNEYHREAFKKQTIRIIQGFQQKEFVEELMLEFPEVFEREEIKEVVENNLKNEQQERILNDTLWGE